MKPKEKPLPERGIFCNRTLNLKAIKAIGYDMDYTLIHYRMSEWEGRAYEYIKQKLLDRGWPVEKLNFDPRWVIRGLIIDTHLGNLVKTNRFGYIKRVAHGTAFLDYESLQKTYSRTVVDLSESRFVFVNTFFSVSEGCIYSQLVEMLDREKIPEILGYEDLYRRVNQELNLAHLEGEMKNQIMADPEKYVVLDPEMPLTLLDQKRSGKKLLLITNAEWAFMKSMMTFAFDRFLPERMTWRDLFHLVVASAKKPEFFSARGNFFRIINEEGHLLPSPGGIGNDDKFYLGGNAAQVEEFLKLSGEEILYVGDHIFSDVKVSKMVLRWRTALILRELEREIRTLEENRKIQRDLQELMDQKEELEREESRLRLAILQAKHHYGPGAKGNHRKLEKKLGNLRKDLGTLNNQISPLVTQVNSAFNQNWGYLMRTGNDKSRLTRQIENSADIYTSRVSNFLHYTPFFYFRSLRGSLPHDMGEL